MLSSRSSEFWPCRGIGRFVKYVPVVPEKIDERVEVTAFEESGVDGDVVLSGLVLDQQCSLKLTKVARVGGRVELDRDE